MRRLVLVDAESGRAAARVLIADGRPLVRAGYRAMLEAAERLAVVAEAQDGDHAVVLARRTRPDVVLMDVGLPGRDPVDATRALLRDAGAAVTLLADSDADERIIPALRAGASGLVLKDTEPDELARAIEVVARGDAHLPPGVTRRVIAEMNADPELDAPARRLLARLTAREREVVALVAIGLNNEEIAERLVVSPETSRTHVSRAMVKLGARDRAQLVVYAYRSGLAPAATRY
jgi:DNA-binding NarL/FixJ family response regulator